MAVKAKVDSYSVEIERLNKSIPLSREPERQRMMQRHSELCKQHKSKHGSVRPKYCRNLTYKETRDHDSPVSFSVGISGRCGMKNHFIVPPGLFTRQHKQRSQFHLFMEVRIALGLFAPLLFFDIFLQSSPSNFREFCRKLSNKSAVFYNKPAFPSSYTGKSKKILPSAGKRRFPSALARWSPYIAKYP